MLEKTRAYVLKTIPFRESGLIVKAFTESGGARSFLVNGIRKNGKTQQNSYFMPMRELEMVYQKSGETNDLFRLKEFRAIHPLHRVYEHPAGISLLIFYSEILYKSLVDHHTDEALYDFISEKMTLAESSRLWAGLPEGFVTGFITQCGIGPTLNYAPENKYFSIKEGRFCPFPEGIAASFHESVHKNIFEIFRRSDKELFASSLPSNIRRYLLELLLEYLYIHLMPDKSIRSHEILQEIL